MKCPPQIREFMVFAVHGVLWSHGCRTFADGCFSYPKSFVHATASLHMLRAFSGGLSVLGFRTQSWNEHAKMEPRRDLPVDFWFCGTDLGADFPERRCPFFPVQKNTRQIYATQKNLKLILKHFPNGFSGRSTLVCVAAFGCQYFYADQPKL